MSITEAPPVRILTWKDYNVSEIDDILACKTIEELSK